jgi:FkbM family methyltransferase
MKILKTNIKKVLIFFGLEKNMQLFNYKVSFLFPNYYHPRKVQYIFFKQFIKKDNLVFDIGANIGERVSIFLELKAKVVAIEPQLICIEKIIKDNKNVSNLYLENIGVGDREGFLEMSICEIDSKLSTFSKNQINNSYFSGSNLWNKKVKIQVKTIDQLIIKYGFPDFVKIDVEGFELNVLLGLSTPIKSLSFEFSSYRLDDVEKCLDLLIHLSKDYKFNISYDEYFLFDNNNWLSSLELMKTIELKHSNTKMHFWGDIYAKLF